MKSFTGLVVVAAVASMSVVHGEAKPQQQQQQQQTGGGLQQQQGGLPVNPEYNLRLSSCHLSCGGQSNYWDCMHRCLF
ncbi:hypothetical protein GGF40_000237 [Coemansia sp. RSA 1286]|nr:hypothetical protein IWW45_004726 [Coemansia sp. RSA 485]KAJ2640089.1 hypothetical protein GGF40_000237 [Coemansia sp. RSA 1286]